MNTQEEEYVTLFCEGDGGVYLNYSNQTKKKYLRVSFSQMERDALDYIASLTEGGCFHQGRSSGIWHLQFNGSHCVPLLEIFSRHVVGRDFLERLNKVLVFADISLTVQHPLTFNGFLGFWDAEGSSSNMPQISVSQKDREILNLIATMFGGNVSPNEKGIHYWVLCGDEARKLYKTVVEKSHCPGKRERLREDFEGPTQYEQHKDARKAYSAHYYSEHKEGHRISNAKSSATQKAIREWIRVHPEEIAKLREKL